MLGSKDKEKRSMAVDNILNTISRGTVIEGKIHTKGDIRIEGKVIGTVTCESKLVIGEHGYVEGFVDARNAHVSGQIKGEVICRELLQLQEKARVEGDIFTQKLSVQVGAAFTGNCQMGESAKTMGEQVRSRAAESGKPGKTRSILSPPKVSKKDVLGEKAKASV